MTRLLNLLRKIWIHKNDPICLAPWVHAHVKISGERQICCQSLGLDTNTVLPLNEFWNGKYMKKIRKTMLQGKVPADCNHCVSSNKIYKSYNKIFSEYKQELLNKTNRSGKLNADPIAFDYRTSNLCNFKCRSCQTDSSSRIEAEKAEYDGIYSLKEWQREPNKSKLNNFHNDVSRKELLEALDNGKLKEIYWAGGEPLLLDFHWQVLQKILDQNLESKIAIRYTTNLSHLTYRGKNLFEDYLRHFSKFSVLASLDATGEIGEYLRVGMVWDTWQKNYKVAMSHADQKEKNIGIATCLSIPSILDLKNSLLLANQYECDITAIKVHFGMDIDYTHPLSPLALPENILIKLVKETTEECNHLRNDRTESIFECLNNYLLLKKQEPSHLTKMDKIKNSKRYANIEKRRPTKINLNDILSKKDYLQSWYSELIQ